MLSPNIEANHNTDLAELVQQVSASHRAIGLSVDGHQQAVILSLEAFKQLLSSKVHAEHGQLSEPDFHQALVEAGFDTREKIIDLVREVKREVATEYGQMYSSIHQTPLTSDS